MSDLIVGIDLGTTNSEVATFVDGHVRVLGPEMNNMLPSVVGLSPSGELLVGEPARNQLVLYPERTVRSIKRKMGSNETVMLGDRQFTPPEISALILRKLAAWASRSVQQPVHKVVITVPAYFSDAQRQATREAAALAGLEAIRILNEPTAASLAYGEGTRHTAMVYDLGGGTFDVSIVALEGAITEVLASHGNNQLGGDDFNDLLAEHLLAAFQSEHGIDLAGRLMFPSWPWKVTLQRYWPAMATISLVATTLMICWRSICSQLFRASMASTCGRGTRSRARAFGGQPKRPRSD